MQGAWCAEMLKMQVEVLLHQDMPEGTLEEAQDVLPWARRLPALHAWCLQLLRPSKRDPQQGKLFIRFRVTTVT
jgi:hypothetical protein